MTPQRLVPVFLLMFLFSNRYACQSQISPPTLSAGLTALTGSKGDIDVAVLAELISQKQDELRNEALQRYVLDRMEDNSFALNNYVYSNLNALLTFKDIKAIEKELLTQTSILALQVGISETILQLAIRPAGRKTPIDLPPPLRIEQMLKWTIAKKFKMDSSKHNVDKIYTRMLEKLHANQFMLLFSVDNVMREAANPEFKSGVIKSENKNIKFSALFLDCIYDVCRQNSTLQDLGFVKINPTLKRDYGRLNKYLSPKGGTTELNLYVEEIVDLLVNYHPLLTDFLNDHKLKVKDLVDETMIRNKKRDVFRKNYNDLNNSVALQKDSTSWSHSKLSSANVVLSEVERRYRLNLARIEEMESTAKSHIEYSSMEEKLINVNTLVDTIKHGIAKLDLQKDGISISDRTQLAKQFKMIVEGMNDFNLRTNRGMNKTLYSANDYSFIRDKVIPFSTKMMSLGIFGSAEMNLIGEIEHEIFSVLIVELNETITKSDLQIQGLVDFPIGTYSHLIRILVSISQLDQVNSFEHIFNTLAQVGLNSVKNSDLKYLRDLIYYIDAYANVDLDSNRLNVEVEDLLLKLLSLYENAIQTDVNLYFGMGLGQTMSTSYSQEKYQLLNKDSSKLRNLGFASEKVGFKIKFINNKRLQSKPKEELSKWSGLFRGNHVHNNRSPLISDVYVFGYGSGLLYNIADVTSEGDKFDYVLIGGGMGVAFFNALDFNIWISSPLVSGENWDQSFRRRRFIGISFDVKLTEYLSAVGKKRREAKIAKTNKEQ